MSFDGEAPAADDVADVGGPTQERQERAWDEILAAFDTQGYKPGDVVSDSWISHTMRVPLPSELEAGITPRQAISACRRWQRTCEALVEKVREDRKLHLVSVTDGYVILDPRAAGDHHTRSLTSAIVAHAERTSHRLDLVPIETLSTEERDRLVRQKQAVALFQRTSLPRFNKAIGPGSGKD